jgi:hypothetical protein
MTSKIKVDNITNQSDSNIVNKCGTTITLGASGDTVTLAAGASQSGFGRTGTVDWDTTAKTASFTAVSGNGYFVNTTSGAITVTLPAGSAGDIVSLADYTNTWQTNAVTVTPNGSDKIGGTNANTTLTTEGQSVTFVYVDDTEGWKNVQDSTSNAVGRIFLTATGGTVTCCGDYKIHTFTSPGTFCVSAISNVAADNTVSYLVVAGGGGGSGQTSNGGGGAGAGGFREFKGPVDSYTASPLNGSTPITVTATAFPITVGAGGVGPASNGAWGTPGSNSVFSTVTSAGGGQGSSHLSSCVPANMPGGSGGGGFAGSPTTVGTGNTPPVSPPQGNNGGPGTPTGPFYSGGGGGGATAAGVAGTAPKGGDGGAGATTSISGSSTAYAGGGGGGITPSPSANPSTIGVGGTGGGGPGGAGPNTVGVNGTANTGGGGGGASPYPALVTGGTGGSGIVIIRYKYQ